MGPPDEEVPHETDGAAAGGRKMRFEEAYGGWQERRLTQEEAARMLGVCERTFRRYVDRYEEEGLDGLVDKRLGRCRRVRHRSMR